MARVSPMSILDMSETVAALIPDPQAHDPALLAEIKDEIENFTDEEKEVFELVNSGELTALTPKGARGEIREILMSRGWKVHDYWRVAKTLATKLKENNARRRRQTLFRLAHTD